MAIDSDVEVKISPLIFIGDEIDLKRAEAALERAKERLAVKAADTDVARAELALRKALVRIEAKKY